ncbi:hypothetical protein SLS63_003487 [Diaporthe eres]|uniref:Uncharacterized protein n=1 Tax=Diaporthe eres TaxID=83184 RepID=A0ABR1PG18_DIAER
MARGHDFLIVTEIPVAILDEFVPNIGTDNPSEKIIWKVVAAKCTYPYDLISLALSPGTEFLATSVFGRVQDPAPVL